MPAKDIYHDAVKNALIKEGWIITDDPLHLKWGQKDMYVDLGAKEPIGTLLIETENLNLLVFNPETERITQWIPEIIIVA